LFLLSLTACEADPCRQLCTQTARAIEPCLDEWGVGWDEFGAASRRNFAEGCRNAWEDERSGLEPRQVASAEDRCDGAQSSLADMTCDELRAVYLE
jgi:hypothetical protein